MIKSMTFVDLVKGTFGHNHRHVLVQYLAMYHGATQCRNPKVRNTTLRLFALLEALYYCLAAPYSLMRFRCIDQR